MYYLYIIRCADKTLYTGITKDVKRRLIEHNSLNVGAKYTKARRPVKLVFKQMFKNRSTALRAEAKIKKLSRKDKQIMIKTRQR